MPEEAITIEERKQRRELALRNLGADSCLPLMYLAFRTKKGGVYGSIGRDLGHSCFRLALANINPDMATYICSTLAESEGNSSEPYSGSIKTADILEKGAKMVIQSLNDLTVGDLAQIVGANPKNCREDYKRRIIGTLRKNDYERKLFEKLISSYNKYLDSEGLGVALEMRRREAIEGENGLAALLAAPAP